MRLKIVVAIATIFFLLFLSQLNNTLGLKLDANCQPLGLSAKVKERWSPEEFWAGQLREIEAKWKLHLQYREFEKIDDEQFQVNQEFERKKMEALGIKTDIPPDFTKLLNESEQLINEMRESTHEHLKIWIKQCSQIAHEKLTIFR